MFGSKKIFGAKKIWDNNFWIKKILGPKLGKSFIGSQICGPKNFGFKKILCPIK